MQTFVLHIEASAVTLLRPPTINSHQLSTSAAEEFAS